MGRSYNVGFTCPPHHNFKHSKDQSYRTVPCCATAIAFAIDFFLNKGDPETPKPHNPNPNPNPNRNPNYCQVGKHKQMGPREYLAVMQQSKFCLAPSGMGFSTRMYESTA